MSDREPLRQIAIYGKSGVGRPTTVQNLTAGLAESGEKMTVVSCDPKADSTRLLLSGLTQRIVLDILCEIEDLIELSNILREGCLGIKCVESGDPEPDVGCVGHGIITSINLLERLGAYTEELDYVFYDVLGDVVCGGFAIPIQGGKAKEIYIAANGGMMALYAVNNVSKEVVWYAGTGGVRLGGTTYNSRNVDHELDLLRASVIELGIQLVYLVSRNNVVQWVGARRRTVIKFNSESRQAREYRNLAEAIDVNMMFTIPKPVTRVRLEETLLEHGLMDLVEDYAI